MVENFELQTTLNFSTISFRFNNDSVAIYLGI